MGMDASVHREGPTDGVYIRGLFIEVGRRNLEARWTLPPPFCSSLLPLRFLLLLLPLPFLLLLHRLLLSLLPLSRPPPPLPPKR